MKGGRAAQRAWDAMEPPDDEGPACPECGEETENHGPDGDETGPCYWIGACNACLTAEENDDD